MENLHVLQKLKELIPCERFILGGSHAIRLHGIALTKEPEDFDIIIENPRYGCNERLTKLQMEHPNPRLTETASMAFSFYFMEVKCDVWIKPELTEHPLLSYEGILINSVADIVDWKTRFKRSKDWVQLMQWSRSIFDKRKFEDSLMEIGTGGDGDISGGYRREAPVKKVKDPLDWSPHDDDDLPF